MTTRTFDIKVAGFTPGGFSLTLEMNGVEGEKLKEMIAWVDEKLTIYGFMPGVNHNGTKATQQAMDLTAPTCAIHNAPMEMHTKGTSRWYSHQLEDGSWCRGKAKEK